MNTLCYIDADAGSLIFDFIIGLIIFVVIFLIVRSIFLWYWKIDVIVKNQEEQIALLKQLVQQQIQSTPTNPNPFSKPKFSDGDVTVFSDEGKTRGFICSAKDLSTGSMWPAAKNICKDYREGGFSNWRLPTKEELVAIYETLHKNSIGGFENGIYWSSTEFGIYDAMQIDFSNGTESAGSKSSLNFVRSVRSF